MSKIKFTLKAIRSTVVHALNGKSYRLHAGSNKLDLEYSDYTSLMKALGLAIKPEPLPVTEKPEVVNTPVEEKETEPAETPKEADPAPAEVTKESEPAPAEAPAEAEPESAETPAEAESNKVDYSAMSYTELKAEYKRITGESCKLKKAEVIKFLQERDNA